MNLMMNESEKPLRHRPLAVRVRPKKLEDFIGQDHLVGEGKPFYQLAQRSEVHSMILWGPSGSGKTTLARILVQTANARMIEMSAVLSGVKDVRRAVMEAEQRVSETTVVFVDEVHRFNKAQQDAFLPHVEVGTITFIGATSENPSFEVISPLLSRTRVFVLKQLQETEIKQVVERALQLEFSNLTVDPEAIDRICFYAEGDARRALNLLELATQIMPSNRLEPDVVDEARGHRFHHFDKGGDQFYEQISALHKSLRGSDPNAAIYWFSRMIDGGCDPLYIARRLLRFAVEDVGTADIRALAIARDAWDAYARLGSPEGELAIAEAVIYLACTPKSNAVYVASKNALDYVRSNPAWTVPLRFRNAPTQLMRSMNYGEGYRYAHDEEQAFVADERYFPDEMDDETFYHPTDRGLESRISERLRQLSQLKKKH